MKLLSKIKSLRRMNCSSLINSSKGWCRGEESSKIVRREINRSERTGSPLSFIFLNLSNSKNNEISKSDYHSFLKELIHIISENTRDYDVKFLRNQYRIVILLADTASGGAKAFIDKLSKKIYDHFESLNRVEYLNIIQALSVCTYPSGKSKDTEIFTASPIIKKYVTFKKK
ncbi:MAG: hypothetical protein ACE5OP_13655 [Candidatus Glassbacteria bacterium]